MMNPLNMNQINCEKAIKVKLRFQKLKKTTNFFRVFEIFLVIAVITRVSIQLPSTLPFNKTSHEYFHNLSHILVSPKFMFILGNVIIITLFINSGHFNTPYKVMKPSNKRTTHNNEVHKRSHAKKQVKIEETSAISAYENNQVVKIYRRSKSEKLRREKMEKGCCRLKRSNTEIKSLKSCGSNKCCKEGGETHHYPEDHMSNEEFRNIIEKFIAKQQRLLRQQEENANVGVNFELN